MVLVLPRAPQAYDQRDQDEFRRALELEQAGTNPALLTIPFSATPTFDASKTNSFFIALTANVTSSTLVNARDGQVLSWLIQQDPASARTFAWPTTVKGGIVIGAGLSTVSGQIFQFQATLGNAYALSAGVTGM